MSIELRTPTVDDLGEVLTALRDWQSEGARMQLHPGDIGWFYRFGEAATAAALRTWSSDGEIVAVGLQDGSDLLRMTTAPAARKDENLAREIVRDVSDPARGVLPAGRVNIEAPMDAVLQDLLATKGWGQDEPWTPLLRDLAEPVADPGVRIEVVGPDFIAERVAVHRASFARSIFTAEAWQSMAAGPAYADARCLVAFDDEGTAVAAVTVWSAGEGKPGLIEPMGAHAEYRGRGYGRAITVAAAAALRSLGSSSVLVCTASSNVGGVATYRSAGMTALTPVRDRYRDA